MGEKWCLFLDGDIEGGRQFYDIDIGAIEQVGEFAGDIAHDGKGDLDVLAGQCFIIGFGEGKHCAIGMSEDIGGADGSAEDAVFAEGGEQVGVEGGEDFFPCFGIVHTFDEVFGDLDGAVAEDIKEVAVGIFLDDTMSLGNGVLSEVGLDDFQLIGIKSTEKRYSGKGVNL